MSEPSPKATTLSFQPKAGAKRRTPFYHSPNGVDSEPAYRIWQELGPQQTLRIFDLKQDKLSATSPPLPRAESTNRPRELWAYFPNSFTYQVETRDDKGIVLARFAIRNDTGMLFHSDTVRSPVTQYKGPIAISSGTQWLHVIGYSKSPQDKGEEHELLLLHHKRYLSQKIPQKQTSSVYHSDSLLVTLSQSEKANKRLVIYRVVD